MAHVHLQHAVTRWTDRDDVFSQLKQASYNCQNTQVPKQAQPCFAFTARRAPRSTLTRTPDDTSMHTRVTITLTNATPLNSSCVGFSVFTQNEDELCVVWYRQPEVRDGAAP